MTKKLKPILFINLKISLEINLTKANKKTSYR